jgi:hypothetical protein
MALIKELELNILIWLVAIFYEYNLFVFDIFLDCHAPVGRSQ